MTRTLDQKAASRRNGQKSQGPRTAEGKAISRRNGLKHGLTGAGVVLPDEDVKDIDGRFDRLRKQMHPRTELGLLLLNRICLFSLRLDRSAQFETGMLTLMINTAQTRHVEDRLREVDILFDGLRETPYTNTRQLQQTPEGVDRLLDAYESVRVDLTHPTLDLYDVYHFQVLESLMGRRMIDFPASRTKALSQAYFGVLTWLHEGETAEMDQPERKAWAKAGILAIIETEVAKLRVLRQILEPITIANTIPQAIKVAKVALSPEALLVRKYEAATERSFYKAIREFHEVESRYDEALDDQDDDVTPDEETTSESSGSDFLAPKVLPRRTMPEPGLPPVTPLESTKIVVDREFEGAGGDDS